MGSAAPVKGRWLDPLSASLNHPRDEDVVHGRQLQRCVTAPDIPAGKTTVPAGGVTDESGASASSWVQSTTMPMCLSALVSCPSFVRLSASMATAIAASCTAQTAELKVLDRKRLISVRSTRHLIPSDQ
jgi:hypothetical protein